MDKLPAQRRPALIDDTRAAALVLAVGMGIGRFAFTGMYPLMVRDHAISLATGSWAASANYAGYLLGALLVSRAPLRASAPLSLAALWGTVLLTLALAVPMPTVLFIAIRIAAGVFSALAMVAASVWLLQAMGKPHRAPALYAGVGVGILISAELIAVANRFGWGSYSIWALLALAALVLSGLSLAQLRQPLGDGAAIRSATAMKTDPFASTLSPWTLISAYGLAGFGYIVTATYLPLLVKDALGNIDPVHVWAAFGLGAIPSCFLWHALHTRYGTRRALALNLCVQAVGVVLPACTLSPIAFVASAVLVGGTFAGTVTIAMPAARSIASRVRFSILAAMTGAYGVGQIAGPLVSNALFAWSHSFNPSLLCAGAALLVGAAACAI